MRPSLYIQEACDMQGACSPQEYIRMALAYRETVRIADDYKTEIPIWAFYRIHDLIMGVESGLSIRTRTGPAVFANGREGLSPELIIPNHERLLDHQHDITANEFYWELMEIHPYQDGNGRLGSLLWNWFRGGLSSPNHPPDKPSWSL